MTFISQKYSLAPDNFLKYPGLTEMNSNGQHEALEEQMQICLQI